MAKRPIYMKFDEGQEPTSVNELLKKLFSYRVGYDIRNITTYSNRQCTNAQCHAGRLRSFDDVMRIVGKYFPDTDYLDVFKELLQLDIRDAQGRPCNLDMGTCSTIRKQRMSFNRYSSGYEQARRAPKYRSEHSWREMLDAIGLDTVQKYIEFITTKR